MDVLGSWVDLGRGLLRVYGCEWSVAGTFFRLSLAADGVRGGWALAKLFREEFEREVWFHLRLLVERIESLGVSLSAAPTHGCNCAVEPGSGLRGLVEAGLRAKRCVVEAYRDVYSVARMVDPVTASVVEKILHDEARRYAQLAEVLRRLEKG